MAIKIPAADVEAIEARLREALVDECTQEEGEVVDLAAELEVINFKDGSVMAKVYFYQH